MEQPIPGPMPGAPPAEPMAQAAPDGLGETQQATPEEQAVYDRFVARGYQLIYDKAMFPKVLELLQGGGDPVEGLARATAMIVSRVAEAAKQADARLSGDVLLHAGTEIFEDLATLATDEGIHDFVGDADALEGAYFRALDIFRGMLQASGGIDQAAAKADFDRLVEMDKGGQLEQVFRGLAEGDAGDKAEPEPEEPPAGPMPSGGLMQGMQ